MSENKNELARKLGLGAVIALGVGTTAGRAGRSGSWQG